MKKLFWILALLALLAALSVPAALADEIAFDNMSMSHKTNVDLSPDKRTLTVTYSTLMTTTLGLELMYDSYSGNVSVNMGGFSPDISSAWWQAVNVRLWVESGGVPVSPVTLYYDMSGDYTLSTTFSHIDQNDLSFDFNRAQADAWLSLAGVSKYVSMYPSWGSSNHTDGYSFSGSDTGNQYGSTLGLNTDISWRSPDYTGPSSFNTLLEFQQYFGVSGDSLSATISTTLALNFQWTLSLDELPSEPGPGPEPGPNSTPEPGTILLLGSSLLMGARLRKKFKTGRSVKN